MNNATNEKLFHPYKIIQQSRSSLQLQPGGGTNAAIIIFRLVPLLMAVAGIVLYIVEKDIFFLYIFCGIAVFEAFIFSFIKIPAALNMDSVGFRLETLSILGRKETDYLWNDVDYIRHRMVRGKNSTSLNYQAILKSRKKVSFLTFGNYYDKKDKMAEINTVLQQISSKEVREK